METGRARAIRAVALLLLAPLGAQQAPPGRAAHKRIVLVAGPLSPSHGPLEHEHNAGVLLLRKCLQGIPAVTADAHLNGWPKDPQAFDGADAIVIYANGGRQHLALQEDRLPRVDALAKKGAGIVLIHWAVEPRRDGTGRKEFLDWIGGYFEIDYSVNPHWEADFRHLPPHPITRGVQPFRIYDEWCYNMRFRDGMTGVTPILTAIPAESTLDRPDGTHSGNPYVRAMKGQPQHVAWAAERPGGGRGFAITGAHYHLNWGEDNFRKIVLNAVLWVARAEIPPQGVECAVTAEELQQNLDPKSAPASRPKAQGGNQSIP